ncbi:MAG: cation transporter [Oscillospiraceae bacterium]|nr:cation transporter [Oscillospiraceae bacterium]
MKNRRNEIVRVSVVGIAANVVLVIFKAVVGLVSGSIAVLLDAVNNLSDALSSVITIVATKLAGRAPDAKHPYGHGRIENIGSVTIAVIILLAGITAFRESVAKILQPERAEYSIVSLIIIVAAIAVKLLLGHYVKRRGKELHAESLVASGSDALFDAVISASTLVAAVVSILWHVTVEGWLGAVIAAVIIKSGVEILMDSLNTIIGQRVDSELAVKLKQFVCGYEGVHGAYDLSLHNYGPEKIVGAVHVEVDDTMTAREIHYLTRSIAAGVYREFGIVLTVGIYAADTSGGESAALRAAVEEIAAEYPEFRQLHGFYADVENKNVTFDLILAFGCDAAGIRDQIVQKLSERFPGYSFDVVLDSDLTD